jgi:UDP-N-acetylglucosamine 1-carboxyvinyltransferase
MEDVFVIQGLGGKRSWEGEITVKGAKNAALKALSSSVLFEDTLRLENVPNIEDISRTTELLENIGAEVIDEGENTMVVKILRDAKPELSSEIAKRFRGSIVLTGPVLARFGSVSLPHPGGCVIGKRPVDIFLEGFTDMGAEVTEGETSYSIEAPEGGLKGADIFLRVPSVTATETFMMAGVLANGTTHIKNAALEPEIISLANFLNECGAKIRGIGTPFLEIEGGKLLKADGKSYVTPPDRIEAGSLAILGALAGRDVRIKPAEPQHLDSLLEMLSWMGVSVSADEGSIRVKGDENAELGSADIRTHEYPGFPTDLQAPMTVLLTQAEGESLVFETIFEGRLHYVEELTWMGADILTLDPHRVLVRGKSELRGRELKSPDLRAGIAYVLAAVVAEGESVIHNVYNIDRGYEDLEARLAGLGVDIKRREAEK